MRTSARSRRFAIASAFLLALGMVQVGGGGPAQSQEGFVPTDCHSSSRAVADFDENGSDDLVVGSPGDDLGQQEIDLRPVPEEAEVEALNTGSINIIYSDPGDGLHPGAGPENATKVLHGDIPGVQRNAQPGDRFGHSVAVGDFNGNGLMDLAVGAPGKFNSRGAVHIFYNHPGQGIRIGVPGSALFNQIFTQDTRFVRGTARPGNRFGWSLAAGDFNGDGTYDDLAIGAPLDNRRGRNAGSVTLLYGSATGLNPQGAPGGSLENRNVAPAALQAGDLFGWALAAGDFLGNDLTDLAVGSPGRNVGQVRDTGAVYVFHNGGPGVGLRANVGPAANTPEGQRNRFKFFHQNTGEIRGSTGANNIFGCSLAAGDFDGDGMDDLAIGIPGQRVGAVTKAGAVSVLYNAGPRFGLTATPPPARFLDCPGTNCWTESQLWTENAGGIPGIAKFNDRFGNTLLAVDFDRDGVGDLVIGLPDEELYGLEQAGSIRVMQGFPNFGLTDRIDLNRRALAFAQRPSSIIFPADFVEQGGFPDDLDYTPVGMVVEEDDRFGATLAAGDFNGNGFLDLAVGVPNESVGLLINYATEEILGFPQDVKELPDELQPLFHLDDRPQAGVVQVVYSGPFGNDASHIFDTGDIDFDVMYRDPGAPHSTISTVAGAVGIPESNGRGLLATLFDGDPRIIGNPGHPHPGNVVGDRFGGGL